MKSACFKRAFDRCDKKRGLNLLFVAADEVIQHRFAEVAKTVNKNSQIIVSRNSFGGSNFLV